ncbi:hypothetical protein IV203_012739 [Nitzschia inconspicua]|uniref:1-aminocyclopropane-1-carboxylate deaminase n=1 Tax=Nitzschia inconspicua TaxID=303405 RepID=A0A9K3PBC2_9STRA|nr:hypothetical protein IV203_012739 [Nitzschia inconspicua]
MVNVILVQLSQSFTPICRRITTTSRLVRQRWRVMDQNCHEVSRTPIQHKQQQQQHFSTLDDFMDGMDFDRLLQFQEQQQQQQQQQQPNKEQTYYKSENGWKTASDLSSSTSNNTNNIIINAASPVEERTICGRTIYIKRDDLLKLPESGISGNKARKLWALDQIPVRDFPPCIVSYGGPQSNSMLALAAIVHSKNRQWTMDTKNNNNHSDKNEEQYPFTSDNTNNHDDHDNISLSSPSSSSSSTTTTTTPKSTDRTSKYRFIYYTKTLPRFLRNQPSGNLFRATSLGMELCELSPRDYAALFEDHCHYEGHPPMGLDPPTVSSSSSTTTSSSSSSLWVPQGGAFALAQPGVRIMAQEIVSYWNDVGNRRPLTVCVPGGTCTTAVLLHHSLKDIMTTKDGDNNNNNNDNNHNDDDPLDIEVVVIPCVGDQAYARRQMMSLSTQIGKDADDIPTILPATVDVYDEDLINSHHHDDDDDDDDAGKNDNEHVDNDKRHENETKRQQRYFVFGKPHKEILDTFETLRDDHDLVVDLMYGAPSWAILLRHWNADDDDDDYDDSIHTTVNDQNGIIATENRTSTDVTFDPYRPFKGREILYVHSGGLEGINSQLLRYKHEGLVTVDEVQLPGKSNRINR